MYVAVFDGRSVVSCRGVRAPTGVPEALCADSHVSINEQVHGQVLPQSGAGG